MSKISLQGIVLPGVDEHGNRWTLRNHEGLDSSPPVRSFEIDPGGGRDGVIDVPPSDGPRSIRVTGTVTSPTLPARAAVIRQLRGLLQRVKYDLLVFDDQARGGEVVQTRVRRMGETLWVRTAPWFTEFSFHVLAPDPRLYSNQLYSVESLRFEEGQTATVPMTVPFVIGPPGNSGRLMIDNVGDQKTWPVIRFRGPLLRPAIRTVGGPRIMADLQLNAGEELVIDTAVPSVRLGLANRRHEMSFDTEFFGLEPGLNDLHFSAEDGTGVVIVEWRAAW